MTMAALSLAFLAIVSILVTEGTPISDVHCSEMFEYGKVSDGKWKANLTLTSESDLRGVWVRFLTIPKFENLVVSDAYQVKYDGDEVRISRRDDKLDEGIPKTLEITGTLVNGKLPQVMSIVLNGRLICSTDEKNNLFDLNNKNYLQSISQNINETTFHNNKCGKALLLNSLIPNDNIKVLPGNWPWQAGLFKNSNGTLAILCEATLVSEDSLLTSAHCVTYQNTERIISPSILEVRLKNLNVEEKNEEDIYKVKKIILHPGFDGKKVLNDIAIIKLEKSVKVDETTQPICLPNIDKRPEESFVLGYGFKADGTLWNLGVAKMVPMDRENCVTKEPLYRSLINDNNYCAGYVQEHEVCIGSSGSGVMDVRSNSEVTWELRGVMSIGRGLQENFRCNQDSPVLVVDVSNYLNWIKSNLN